MVFLADNEQQAVDNAKAELIGIGVFIQANWAKFKDSVKFYRNGAEVAAPW